EKEELAIFQAYLSILDSSSLGDEVREQIREGNWAQGSLRKVVKKYTYQFASMDDEYLKERAADVKDLGRRILSHLQALQPKEIEYPEDTILLGEEITPGDIANVPEGRLKGVVSVKGSTNSHTAIIAKSMKLPTVMGIKGVSFDKIKNANIVVDGYLGKIYISPSQSLLDNFAKLSLEEQELDQSLEQLRTKSAETPDGHRVQLCVNVGLAADAGMSLSVGAEGIGLYRTEVPFMSRDSFPTEEEQRIIYRQLLNTISPKSVTMRTLDIGGDKSLPYFPIIEDNPFLGWRGIRVTLDHPEVFLIQIRALLKASIELDNLKILLPMISSIEEVEESLSLINQAYSELIEEKFNVVQPSIGVMIEVPSAVYLSKEIAKRVDFLSVGTNDLVQYLLAVDRNNSRIASCYQSLHPSVIRALIQIVNAAHGEGKTVSICGEMASDPLAVILLLAMGFDTLSMNAVSLPRIKWVIRSFSMSSARKILNEVLELENFSDIRLLLEQHLVSVGLGGLIRAGKS
ncbi:MAG: phosphoenolpyruvate--protein phosphotransferase, partial [Legionellales bacterium]|nr:phosphoenolpyruvate--protein phosphotransferase [Legionellales bacterium]